MKRGIICGVFDLFHYGHLLALKECRLHCDQLTVAINKATDFDKKINPGKEKPVFPFEHRMEIMRECRLVDEVMGYASEEELLGLLRRGRYDVRFLGSDYQNRAITGEGLTSTIVYLNRNHGFSTTYFKDIIRKS